MPEEPPQDARLADVIRLVERELRHQAANGLAGVAFINTFTATAAGAPYAGVSGIEALLTVSQDNAALLRYAFPDPEHAGPPADGPA